MVRLSAAELHRGESLAARRRANDLEKTILPACRATQLRMRGAVFDLLAMAKHAMEPFVAHFVLPAIHAEQWEHEAPFFRGKKISHGVTYWATTILGLVHDISVGFQDTASLAHKTSDQRHRHQRRSVSGGGGGGGGRGGSSSSDFAATGRRAVAEMLLESLRPLCAAYLAVRPSRGRAGQYRTDLFAIVAVALHALHGVGVDLSRRGDSRSPAYQVLLQCSRLMAACALVAGSARGVLGWFDADFPEDGSSDDEGILALDARPSGKAAPESFLRKKEKTEAAAARAKASSRTISAGIGTLISQVPLWVAPASDGDATAAATAAEERKGTGEGGGGGRGDEIQRRRQQQQQQQQQGREEEEKQAAGATHAFHHTLPTLPEPYNPAVGLRQVNALPRVEAACTSTCSEAEAQEECSSGAATGRVSAASAAAAAAATATTTTKVDWGAFLQPCSLDRELVSTSLALRRVLHACARLSLLRRSSPRLILFLAPEV